MTTQAEIAQWFDAGVAMGATHMIVVCDTWDYDDYPVYVMPDTSAREEKERRDGKNMQQVMEVYSLSKSKDDQLRTNRVFNYD